MVCINQALVTIVASNYLLCGNVHTSAVYCDPITIIGLLKEAISILT